MGLIFRVTVVGYGEKSICPNTGVSAITTENRHRHLSTAGSPHQPSTNHGKTRSIPVVLAKTYYYCRMSCLSVGLQGFFWKVLPLSINDKTFDFFLTSSLTIRLI
jgi:hypothetical protein